MSQFPSTQWLMVEMAGQSSPAIARAALNHLLARYWQPMFVHLRYKGLSPEAAEDLLQDFIVEILDKNLLAVADRTKGKFRTLLLTALDRFAVSRHRYHTAAKRAPKELRSLDAGAGTDVAGEDATSRAYDRAWALDVLAETLALMQQECEQAGDANRWTLFDRRVLAPLFDDADPPDYAALARDLGLAGEKAAMNLLVTAKRQFARTLRAVVREYVVQTGPSSTLNAAAQLRPGSADAAQSATRQLAEHTIVQAVEREIVELQQILADSRGAAASLAQSAEALRADDSPRKRHFWTRLTQGGAAPAAMGSMLDWGSSLVEGASEDRFDAWVADLLATDVRRLLGDQYPASGTIEAQLLQEPPPLQTLEHLKEWANVQRFTLSASPQGKLADILYFLCIAVALVRGGTRISGMNDAGLRRGWEPLLRQKGLPQPLGAVVEAGLTQLARG